MFDGFYVIVNADGRIYMSILTFQYVIYVFLDFLI